MKKYFKNKIAFVTGASGDIGLAITKELISNGAKLFCKLKKEIKNLENFVKTTLLIFLK